MNNEALEFWKSVNENTCEFASIAAAGAWNEADKLDDTNDDDKDDKDDKK